MVAKKIIISSLLITSLAAHNIFTIGKTYDFFEEDFLVAVKEHIVVNEDAIKDRFGDMKDEAQIRIDKLSPTLSKRPTPATKDNHFYPDTSYVNPEDIKDHNGKLLYPAGYKFDPMHYINLTYDIIFINGNRDEELEWFMQSEYAGNASGRVLITEGEYAKVIKKLNQNIFFATDQIINRLNIRKTPSVVVQVGNRLKVDEIYIKAKIQRELQDD